MVREQYKTDYEEFTLDQARQIGEIIKVNWDVVDIEQFRMGLEVELEHGLENPGLNITNNDPILTAKIVLAHLSEMDDYYTKLEAMEEGRCTCHTYPISIRAKNVYYCCGCGRFRLVPSKCLVQHCVGYYHKC
jgi:hypothetical protein